MCQKKFFYLSSWDVSKEVGSYNMSWHIFLKGNLPWILSPSHKYLLLAKALDKYTLFSLDLFLSFEMCNTMTDITKKNLTQKSTFLDYIVHLKVFYWFGQVWQSRQYCNSNAANTLCLLAVVRRDSQSCSENDLFSTQWNILPFH